MKIISILGAGKLGTTLGRALVQAGYRVAAVSCRTSASAKKSASLIGESTRAFQDNIQAAAMGQWIALTPPDEQITSIAKDLAGLNLKHRLIFHCSGILSADVLHSLQEKGAWVASLHPVQTFASPAGAPELFHGVYFTLEGERKVCSRLEGMVKKMGGIPIGIKKEQKPIYHAACSLSSNLLIALLQTASDLLSQEEIKNGNRILFPLVRQTVSNIEEKGLLASLTGPVVRGDLQTVKIHLAALRKNPRVYKLYRNLAGSILTASSPGISEDKYELLKEWLEDK